MDQRRLHELVGNSAQLHVDLQEWIAPLGGSSVPFVASGLGVLPGRQIISEGHNRYNRDKEITLRYIRGSSVFVETSSASC